MIYKESETFLNNLCVLIHLIVINPADTAHIIPSLLKLKTCPKMFRTFA